MRHQALHRQALHHQALHRQSLRPLLLVLAVALMMMHWLALMSPLLLQLLVSMMMLMAPLMAPLSASLITQLSESLMAQLSAPLMAPLLQLSASRAPLPLQQLRMLVVWVRSRSTSYYKWHVTSGMLTAKQCVSRHHRGRQPSHNSVEPCSGDAAAMLFTSPHMGILHVARCMLRVVHCMYALQSPPLK